MSTTSLPPTSRFVEAHSTPATPRYQLEPDGRYRIDHYDLGPAFSSFLPGLAGPAGVPMWCLYVNRGQCVVSLGVQDKNHAIMEYLPANWAYQLVGVQGFRTFCKLDGEFHEPFRATDLSRSECQRTLRIATDALEICETDAERGLTTRITYFAPVNQPLGTLVRHVQLTNTGSTPRRLDLLDGLPVLLPAGFTDPNVKMLRHISEAYASVRRVNPHVPFYSAKVIAHDEAEITRVRKGNFYAAWRARDDRLEPLEPFVDPHVIFGGGQDLLTPRAFIAAPALDRTRQVWENRLPCALVPATATLEPGETFELLALVGFAPDERQLLEFLPRFARPADFAAARVASAELMDEVLAPALTHSACPALDGYARQNYLDNILRGGVPRALPSADGPTLLHVYARRHGDLERDYNHFVLPAHPLSSGAGNYRDILQNRRSDVWFYADVDVHEILTFVELLQPDGFNPLGIEGYRWQLPADRSAVALCPTTDATAQAAFARLVRAPFQPGEVCAWAAEHGVPVDADSPWLTKLLGECPRRLVAQGHEGGYWIDHWTYICDLLEAYADLYPERVSGLLTRPATVGWFDERAYVVPRPEKYVRRPAGLMQLHAVVDDATPRAPLPATTLLGKLAALLAVKVSSLDPTGRGVAMEAGRPGWNDSMNGLPGLFGSSTCETAELARLARWLRQALDQVPDTQLPTLIAEFVVGVVDLLDEPYNWDRAATLREQLRAALRGSTLRTTKTVAGATLARLLAGVEHRALDGLDRAVNPQTGLLHTYFVHKPCDPQPMPSAFAATPLPLFLEGQVHWLRLLDDPQRARDVYHAVRRSPLFDAQLQMYKLNECLDACPPEIGRARTFTRGWFENESIWTHMSYKYLLELLRCGLHDEFFADAASMLVPFMDPRVYGRSILENSSFLASSANPDPATRGRGFIARLSGSTAEFIHIWRLLTLGRRTFSIADDKLRFAPTPIVPADWFTTHAATIRWLHEPIELPANVFACALLGSTLLVYHNDGRRDTFGPNAVQPVRYLLDADPPVVAAALEGVLAERVRGRACRRLDIWLA